MLSLDINLMFWTDALVNSTRERNVKYAINELKHLSNYLNSKIKCNINLIDYSETKIIGEAVHIPYPSTVYKRAEKINNILSNCNADMLSIIDSDCFICREDYDKLLDTIVTSGKESCITFDVLDFSEADTNKIVYENADPKSFEVSSRFPGRAGMLGAFFITDTDNLKKHGGFNTKFTCWGGEDGEIYDKIYRDGTIKKIPVNRNQIRLFHLSHFSDRSNINYFNHDEYVKNNFF